MNFVGKAHGGKVMKWIDQVGYAGEVRWSGRYCVAAVGGIQSVAPILIRLASVRCKLIHTHFAVDVSARDLKTSAGM